MKSELEKELEKAVKTGMCMNKVVALSDAISACHRETCEGYGVYSIDCEAYVCDKYRRIMENN